MKLFKIRASASSSIVGGSIGLTDAQERTYNELKAKPKLTEKQGEKLKDLTFKKMNPELPSGAKTYCKTWLKEQLYKRRKEFSNKYTDKGQEMEKENLDFISDYFDIGMIIQNEDFFEDDFCTGTPDAILNDTIIDLKSSWDFDTFPLFDKDVPDSAYWWQGQVYMHLTGKRKYNLVYVLSDTPMHLIEKEAYYWAKNNGYQELEESVLNKFFDRMTYQEVPNNLKIKSFKFDYDPTAIAKLQTRVLLSRTYIEQLIKEL